VLLDTKVAYRVRAVLAPDGGGVAQHLERPLAVTTGEPLEVMQKVVKEFLHGLGYYSDQDVSPIPGITKFWWWNSLGPLTVYPSQCAVEVMHTTAQRGSSSWQRDPGHLSFFLPIGSHRARADQIREYGSEIARAIFQGGGPFMLKDSEDLVPRALRRLKYLDDHRNADLREAMLVFANKSKNKGKLRALDLLPDFHPERQLRMAFLANQCGKWQLPSDRRLRHQLVRQKYLQHPGAEEEEVLQAMQDFSRKHGLPTMRTYNGYVFQLGSFMSRNDPSRRDILHFKCATRSHGVQVQSWLGNVGSGAPFQQDETRSESEMGFWSELLAKRSLLSAEEEDVPDVWNFRLRLPPDQHYLAGDVLVVWPEMDSVLVRRFVVDTLERSLTDCIRIRPKCSSSSSPFPSRALTLEEVFSRYVDVSAMPSRHFFHVLSQHTPDELHKKKLSEFASRTLEAKDALYEYCKRERRSAAEVMWDFWTARPPLAELLSALPLLRPRRYSIASSPKWAGPGRAVGAWSLTQRPFWMPLEVSPSRALPRMLADLWGEHGLSEDLDLCVGIVDSVTRSNRQVKGLCSNFLKNAAVGSRLRCSLERGTLQLPALEVPLIMVCPGTGLSPCRALVQARHRQVQSNPLQRPKDLMFLGFRHQRADFLYGEEWDTFEAWLSVQVAFSRDHEDKKVYVQDLIEEQGPHVRRLLDAGAVIFVCGRSHPMPSQVFDAFVEVLQHGGMTAEAATQRLRLMQRTQRYICDTWG
ncbi:unnamed protein product, partial [Effrenium voratum]